MSTPTRRGGIAALLVLLLALVGCGETTSSGSASNDVSSAEATSPKPSATPSPTAESEAAASPSPSPVEYPVTVRAQGRSVEISEEPSRVVSLSPSATEMLFAIDAGDQVVAVDDQSDFPEEAPTTELSGFTPNVEAIVGYEPDLVVAANDQGDLVEGLEAADVPILVTGAPETLDDVYTQIEQLGVATGNVGEAAELVGQMQAEIDEIVGSVPEPERELSYYHELDPTYYTATSDTFIGEVYGLLGLSNIADAAGDQQYPQLSAEYIVDADPDLIFLADTECCDVTVDSVAQRPGWGEITAVRTDRVIPLDEDVASRWGPRIVDFLRSVADEVAAVTPA